MAVLQERDLEMLDIMANFGGKTFKRVLAETCFRGLKNPLQQVANRLYKLKKSMKIFKYVETGLSKNKYAIALNKSGVDLLNDMGYELRQSIVISPQTVNHTILEQITFYYLKKLGKDVQRTIVANWRKEHFHTPDLMYRLSDGNMVYVEIELSKKSPQRYIDTFTKMKKDGVKSVLYVFESDKKMRQIGRIIPVWDKVFYITKDELLIECFDNGKLKAKKQIEILKEIENEENK